MRARVGRMVAKRPGLMPRLHLFGLLILLAPLFAGLQHLIGDRAEPAEVRFTAQQAPPAPVERVVERVVERIVYVPVPVDEARESQTMTPALTQPEPGALPSASAPATTLPPPVFRPSN